MQRLIDLYRQWAGEAPANVQKLPQAGSNREYYRMADADGATVVGVVGTSRDEDHAFVYLSNHFNKRRLPVPRVLAVSDDELCYLQTDLGSVSLFDAIAGGREAGGRYNVNEKELLVRTIRELPDIQIRGAAGSTSATATRSPSSTWTAFCSTSTISSIASSSPPSSISTS